MRTGLFALVFATAVVAQLYYQQPAYQQQQVYQPQQQAFQPQQQTYQPQQQVYYQQLPQQFVQGAPASTASAQPTTTLTQTTTAPTVAGEQCTSGPCCSETKKFLPAGEPCRATTNPCEEMARCNGMSAQCPENPKKQNGVSCLTNGKCTDGYCVEYDCTGLCCADGKIAADGTACGTEGKCEKGTCTVYKEADKHVRALSSEEKEVIVKAQKQVKGELEALLRSHARYIKNREAFNAVMNQTATERLQSALGLNTTSLLGASSGTTESSWLNFSSISIIVGAAIVALAVIIIFVVKPKEGGSTKVKHAKQPKQPKKKSGNDDMSSADYDPPAF